MVFLLIILHLLVPVRAELVPTHTLIVEVSGLIEGQGQLNIGLYRESDAFPQTGKSFRGKTLPVTQTTTRRVRITGLEPAEYALAIFQDLNENGKLDRNLLGIPTEPYGFSGNAPGKWRSPVFSDAAFLLNNHQQVEQIHMASWSDR